MTSYDSSSFSIIPAGNGQEEAPRGEVPAGVSVIYVSVEEDKPRPRREVCGRGPLSAAARALHRAADRVDDVRRVIERAADKRCR